MAESKDETIQLAYCHETRVSHSWFDSMLKMVGYDMGVGGGWLAGSEGPFAVFCSGPNSLVEGRNLAVKRVMDNPNLDWLFFIDTDMGFQPDILDRLMEVADPDERPIVGGLCFAMKNLGSDGKGGHILRPIPTLFDFRKHEDTGITGFAHRLNYKPGEVTQVAGTGAAALLIHRKVLEAIHAEYGPRWFDLLAQENGESISEDLSFCWRAGRVGAPILVHTGVELTHHKEGWVDSTWYSAPSIVPKGTIVDPLGIGKIGQPAVDLNDCRCHEVTTIADVANGVRSFIPGITGTRGAGCALHDEPHSRPA